MRVFLKRSSQMHRIPMPDKRKEKNKCSCESPREYYYAHQHKYHDFKYKSLPVSHFNLLLTQEELD